MRALGHAQRRGQLPERILPLPHAAKKHLHDLLPGTGPQYGLVILARAVLAHADHHGGVRPNAQFRPHGRPVRRGLKAAQIHADPIGAGHPPGREAPGPGLVLPVDGNQQVGEPGQKPFRRVEQQPVAKRRAGEKMEPVGRIQNPGSPLPGSPGRQTADHAAYGRMAVNQGVILPIHQLFDFPIHLKILPSEGRTLKGQVKKTVAVRHLRHRLFGVVAAAQMHLVPLLLKPFHIGQVEYQHMAAQHMGHKQHLLFHVCSSVRAMEEAKFHSSSPRKHSLMA